jgi:hypothetical protein
LMASERAPKSAASPTIIDRPIHLHFQTAFTASDQLRYPKVALFLRSLYDELQLLSLLFSLHLYFRNLLCNAESIRNPHPRGEYSQADSAPPRTALQKDFTAALRARSISIRR